MNKQHYVVLGIATNCKLLAGGTWQQSNHIRHTSTCRTLHMRNKYTHWWVLHCCLAHTGTAQLYCFKATGGHMMPLRCGAVHTQLPCICMCLAMCHVHCVLAGEEGNHRRTQGHILSTPQHHEVQPATYTAASTDQTPGCSAAASCTPVKHHAACRATDAQQSVLHNCDSTLKTACSE